MHDSMLIVLERPAPTPLVTDTIMRLLNQLVAKTTGMGEDLRHLTEGFQELNATQRNYDAKLDALSGTFDAKLMGVERSLAAQINSLSTSFHRFERKEQSAMQAISTWTPMLAHVVSHRAQRSSTSRGLRLFTGAVSPPAIEALQNPKVIICSSPHAIAYTAALHGSTKLFGQNAAMLFSAPIGDIVEHSMHNVTVSLPRGCPTVPQAGVAIFSNFDSDFILGMLVQGKGFDEIRSLAARHQSLLIPFSAYHTAFKSLLFSTTAAAKAMSSGDILQVSLRYKHKGMVAAAGVNKLDPIEAKQFRQTGQALSASTSSADATDVRVLLKQSGDLAFTAAEEAVLHRAGDRSAATSEKAGLSKNVFGVYGTAPRGISGSVMLAVDFESDPVAAHPIAQVFAAHDEYHQVYLTAYDPLREAVSTVCQAIDSFLRNCKACPAGQHRVVDILRMHAVDGTSPIRELEADLVKQLRAHSFCSSTGHAGVDSFGITVTT